MNKDSNKIENIILKKELSRLKEENKKLKQQVEKHKNEKESLKKELKKKQRSERNAKQRTRTIMIEPVKGHQYAELIVRLSNRLYSGLNCGFRQVVKILNIINETFDNLLGRIPCYNTIENWVKKCGLNLYNSSGSRLQWDKYAQIVDESMMIGSEKLLLTLGVPAAHQGAPLSCNNISILIWP